MICVFHHNKHMTKGIKSGQFLEKEPRRLSEGLVRLDCTYASLRKRARQPTAAGLPAELTGPLRPGHAAGTMSACLGVTRAPESTDRTFEGTCSLPLNPSTIRGAGPEQKKDLFSRVDVRGVMAPQERALSSCPRAPQQDKVMSQEC